MINRWGLHNLRHGETLRWIGIISSGGTVWTGSWGSNHVTHARSAMVTLGKVIRRRPTLSRLIRGVAVGYHLLMASRYYTMLWICLILGRGVPRRVLSIMPAIVLWWAMGVARPIFVGVHTFGLR